MKKIISIFLIGAFALCGAPRVFAQYFDSKRENYPVQVVEEEPNNELSLGYGAPINTSKYYDLLSVLYYSEYNKRSIAGPISVEYFHYVTPTIGIGAVAVYNLSGITYYYGDDISTEKVVSATSNISWITLLPAIKFRWLRKEHVGVYSKLSFGATYGVEVITKKLPTEVVKIKKHCYALFPNFHASLVGVEAGSRNVRAFAELGFGEQGIINGGVRYRF